MTSRNHTAPASVATSLAAPGFDAAQFRSALATFATGIAVVTATGSDGRPLGMTVSSFNSVSLAPPLVLFSIDRRARSFRAMMCADAFAVNVLADDQEHLSNRFAKAGADKWDGIEHLTGADGMPILNGVLARFECSPYATYDGGDHAILVGRVIRFTSHEDGQPLIFFRGSYATLDDESARVADPFVTREWPLPIHY